MSLLGSLVVSMAVDTARFQGDLGRAAALAEARMRNIRDISSKMLGAVTVAATVAGSALVVALKKSIDRADELRELAQAAGTTTEELSRLAYAGQQSGVELETVGKALVKLAKGGAPDARAELMKVADEFAAMPDGATKTTRAVELFGEKLGPYLIPLLNEGSAGLKRLADESDRVGYTLSTSAANGADEFNDRLAALKATSQGLVNVLMSDVLPLLNSIAAATKDAATNTDTLARASVQLTTFFRLIIDLGYSAYKTFDDIGSALGALFAASASAATGNFRQAAEILRAANADQIASEQRANEFLRRLWEDREEMAQLAARRLAAVSRGGGGGVLTRFTPEPGGEERPKADDEKAKGPDLDDIHVWQRQIFSLANAQGDALKELNDTTRRDVEAFMVQIGNSSVALTREIGEAWAQQYEDAKKSLGATAAFAEQMGADMRRSLADFLFDPFKDGLDGMLAGFVDMLRQMVAQIAAQQLLTSFFTWGSGLGGGVGGFFGGLLKGITGKATGGPVMGGTPYLVGERGPELFVPRTAGSIVPNGAGGVVLNQSIHIDARGADAERVIALMPGFGRSIRDSTIAAVQQLAAEGRLSRGLR